MSMDQSTLDRLCGDYPAPCNCDDPITHDGAVEAAAGDSSAANWKSALENDEGHYAEAELPWYGDGSPKYGSPPMPAELEAARRFVSHWLEGDSHGFIIPGNEWGRSLKHWLHMLVAMPAPGGEDLPATDRPDRTGLWFPERDRSLVEQVRERAIGPSQWINFLQYDYGWVRPPLDEAERLAALAEARKIDAEDRAATLRALERSQR